MGSSSEHPPKPWVETPCIPSAPMSRASGCNIYLKLENLQPSGSFKSRGVGNLMFRAVESALSDPSTPSHDVHFYCSSGGNAGLACATAAKTLGRPATVVVPMSTLPHMVAKLRDLDADVVQIGENWAAADKHLRGVLIPEFERSHQPGSRAVYVAPFDHQDVWDGAETLVGELRAQMAGRPIDGVVCSVGGGGLLCGIMQGVQEIRDEVQSHSKEGRLPKVLAVETAGGESFNASVRAGELVTIPAITTIATSLGATRVAEEAFAWTQRAGEDLISAVVTDQEAVKAVTRFLDDARILVETACGAAIAPVYNGDLRRYLGKGLTDEEWAEKNIVIVVCGGSNINLGMVDKYRKEFNI